MLYLVEIIGLSIHFYGTIFDDKIYGRGTIDDKGPTIASLYAMKYVMDNFKINKRVRLILGLDEENNWESINYYRANEEHPDVSFSPDADFPCIYAEKEVISSYLSSPCFIDNSKNLNIIGIDCNNNPLNVVPRFCSATIWVNHININSVFAFIKNLANNDKSFDITLNISNNQIQVNSYGKQAHAAHPDLGINAISNLIYILDVTFKHFNCSNLFLEYVSKYIGNDFLGSLLGICFADFSGFLTLNIGYFELKDNLLKLGLNIRVPVTFASSDITSAFIGTIENLPITYEVHKIIPKLNLDSSNGLAVTLTRIFNDEYNSNYNPITIGGATYARAFNNCISFGPNFPNSKDMCHQTDEFISIHNLLFCVKVYARAILEL